MGEEINRVNVNTITSPQLCQILGEDERVMGECYTSADAKGVFRMISSHQRPDLFDVVFDFLNDECFKSKRFVRFVCNILVTLFEGDEFQRRVDATFERHNKQSIWRRIAPPGPYMECIKHDYVLCPGDLYTCIDVSQGKMPLGRFEHICEQTSAHCPEFIFPWERPIHYDWKCYEAAVVIKRENALPFYEIMEKYGLFQFTLFLKNVADRLGVNDWPEARPLKKKADQHEVFRWDSL